MKDRYNNTPQNIALAKKLGFHYTEHGWYDNEDVLSGIETDNTFEKLMFDTNPEWFKAATNHPETHLARAIRCMLADARNKYMKGLLISDDEDVDMDEMDWSNGDPETVHSLISLWGDDELNADGHWDSWLALFLDLLYHDLGTLEHWPEDRSMVVVRWPMSQEVMEHPDFEEECELLHDIDTYGSAAYAVPVYIYDQVFKDSGFFDIF